MINTNLKNKRPTIAVLTNMMATPFSEGIIFGASDYAKRHGYNVLCFTGAEFAKPVQTNMSRDRIFDLVDKDLIDGVMLPMGALSRYISLQQQLSFLERFSNVPVITIASDIPGYMNVGYSPRQGIFDLVDHLIQKHHVQRFAGATGSHLSTIIKKQYFVEAVAENGLHFDEKMFITSDMYRNAPIPALKGLFSGDKESRPQAIVAGTDNQARDILTALTEMGIRVPEDVILTGSMGHAESLFSNPPLTSILEPTYELGWHAAERVVAAIEGRPYKENLVLPTSLVIRRSCGCVQAGDNPILGNTYHSTSIESQTLTLSLIQKNLEQILAAALPEHRAKLAPNTAQILSILLLESLRINQPNGLLGHFSYELERSIKTDVIFLWVQLAQCIHQTLMQQMTIKKPNEIEGEIAAGLFDIVQNCIEKASQYRRFEAEKYIGTMREIGIQLNSEFNLDEISQLLTQDLSITDCYISIFEELNHPNHLMSSVMATRNGSSSNVTIQPYSANLLIPPTVEPYQELFSLLIMPLSFKEDFLGVCVLNIGERKGIVYEGLLTHFSSALKNQIHVRHLKEAEERFSDIAHSASDWLWEIDISAKFKYCSDGVNKVLGYSPESMLGKSIQDFVAYPNASYIIELMQAMNEVNRLETHECLYRHKNGNERVLLTTGKPVIKNGQIVGYRGAYKDISEIKAQEARISTLAYRDSLTDLPNRTLFNERLHAVLAAASRTHIEFAVLFVDLDGFKLINDSMGHDAGDLLLCDVAALFTQCVREEDTLARFGGDEFVILLPNIESGKDAALVAERMTEILSNPFTIRNQSIFITASIGISIFPGDGKTAATLLINADKAMYRSKKNGKNCFSFYEPELEDSINQTVMIRHLLHTAIRENGFHLLFQPQVNNKTLQISGVEALIRFSKGDAQNIGPECFIPLAEEIGLICEVGLWVFKKACQQQRKWADAGHHLKCSINVSAKQFRNPQLADEFINILKETGVDPTMITIEITENAVINDQDRAQAILQKLADYGLSIAIDDFGTGYASLSCLRKIPVNILKIDSSFVFDCDTNTENASIIEAIVMMAKSLKLKIVAEGVENTAHLDFLSKLNCDEMQGYLFAEPLTEDQVTKMFEAQVKSK